MITITQEHMQGHLYTFFDSVSLGCGNLNMCLMVNLPLRLTNLENCTYESVCYQTEHALHGPHCKPTPQVSPFICF